MGVPAASDALQLVSTQPTNDCANLWALQTQPGSSEPHLLSWMAFRAHGCCVGCQIRLKAAVRVDQLTAHWGRTEPPCPPLSTPLWVVVCANTEEDRRAVTRRKKDFILNQVEGNFTLSDGRLVISLIYCIQEMLYGIRRDRMATVNFLHLEALNGVWGSVSLYRGVVLQLVQ